MANRQKRSFEVKEATRTATPLLIGLFGPSGSGKTYSALELAKGVQSVVGGEIVVIDTENRRALHYADTFDFKHIDMQPPFNALDYKEALEFAVNEYGAKTVIIDSMSHEHEGPGGLLETHEAIVQRMAGNDFKKRERVKMLAWSEPKQQRRALLNSVVRLQANMIFCFRAKETSKPQKNPQTGKNEVVPMGFVPIGGDEFVFEMTLAALLLPGAKGVPTFYPENEGEKRMVKLPAAFDWLAERAQKGGQLNQAVGAGLARWASGSTPAPAPAPAPRDESRDDHGPDAQAAPPADDYPPDYGEPAPPPPPPPPPPASGHDDGYEGA